MKLKATIFLLLTTYVFNGVVGRSDIIYPGDSARKAQYSSQHNPQQCTHAPHYHQRQQDSTAYYPNTQQYQHQHHQPFQRNGGGRVIYPGESARGSQQNYQQHSHNQQHHQEQSTHIPQHNQQQHATAYHQNPQQFGVHGGGRIIYPDESARHQQHQQFQHNPQYHAQQQQHQPNHQLTPSTFSYQTHAAKPTVNPRNHNFDKSDAAATPASNVETPIVKDVEFESRMALWAPPRCRSFDHKGRCRSNG